MSKKKSKKLWKGLIRIVQKTRGDGSQFLVVQTKDYLQQWSDTHEFLEMNPWPTDNQVKELRKKAQLIFNELVIDTEVVYE